jgi:FXSXX-COOH protein
MSENAIADTAEFGNGLIDINGLSLSDLDEVGDSLALAVRRLLDNKETGPVAGFSSAI